MPTFSLTDPAFWLQMLQYFLAVFVGYYIPGAVLIRKVPLPGIFHFVVSIVLGMVLFAYQGYILGYLNLRFLSYVYLLVFFVLWLRNHSVPKIRYRVDKKTLLLLIIGSIFQLTTIWFTGITYKADAYYCCGDANDNFFYGTLSREIVHNIPPENPGMAGDVFKNYHYWSNIVVGETSRVFGLPVFQVQFQYSTLLLPVLTGLLLLCVMYSIGGSKALGRWVVFFFYFGSDAIYWLILLLKSGPMFSMTSLEDGIGFLANYPRAMACMCALCGMVLLFLARKKPSKRLTILTALVLASVAGMKIYVGFFVFIGLASLALYDMFKRRYETLRVGIYTLICFIPIYFLSNLSAGGLYYSGFWRVQNFIVQPWLNLLRMEQARLIFEADNKWIPVLYYNLVFTGIYIVAIFGTKIISFINSKASLKQVNSEFHVFMIPALLVNILIGLFFIQETGESNTFNFLVTAFIFLSFYAALVMSRVRYKLLILLILLLTVPRPMYRAYRNIRDITGKKGFSISLSVLDMSRIIRSKTKRSDVVLVDPRSFPFDESGPVFSMLLDRPMYFSGESFLYWFKTPEEKINERKNIVDTVFTSLDRSEVQETLKNTPIQYIILNSNQPLDATGAADYFDILYRNKDIEVLRVQ